jgi:Na+(H+)/acetate symporter ActP
MISWKKTLRVGLVAGTLAGLFSAAVLLMTGRRETGNAAAASVRWAALSVWSSKMTMAMSCSTAPALVRYRPP